MGALQCILYCTASDCRAAAISASYGGIMASLKTHVLRQRVLRQRVGFIDSQKLQTNALALTTRWF